VRLPKRHFAALSVMQAARKAACSKNTVAAATFNDTSINARFFDYDYRRLDNRRS
jgi:hypothetical protein